jgi:hypothetical protein
MNKKSLSLVILASMAMPAFASGLPKVSTREAMQFENDLIAALPKAVVKPRPELLYTQPANHTEPCKLPTSQDQLDRRNFRAYWDGQCKDGYAFGLGRDIALSDTHHVEEITVHHLSVPQDFPRSFVSIDFVNNLLFYGSDNLAQRVTTGTRQQFVRNPDDTMSLNISTGEGRNNGNQMLSMQTSPFEAGVIVTNVREGQPTYFYGDWTAVPGASDRPSFNVAVHDPATRRPVGYGIVRFRNGALEHQGPKGLVQLSKEYVDHLLARIAEANTAVVAAGAETAKAQQMEREYLYAACKSGYVIEGVPAKDIPITHEICTWRDQWKDAYARSQARFEQKQADLRTQAAAREQQIAAQRTQQQQAMQQQAAANAAAWAAVGQSLQQTTNTIQQQNQWLMNFQRSLTPPPATAPSSTEVVCTTFGRIVKCQ